MLLEEQLRRLGGHPAACTFHDELSPDFHPVYFALDLENGLNPSLRNLYAAGMLEA